MPRLEVMQIWNAGRSYASYFTFWRPGPSMRKSRVLGWWYGEEPFVKFKSTWRLDLRAAVAYWAKHGPGLFLPDQPPKLNRRTRCLLQSLRMNLDDLDTPGTVDDTCNHLLPYLFLYRQMLSPLSRTEKRIEHRAGAA